MANCGDCKVDFCNLSNLSAHVKKEHPDKLDVIAPITGNSSVSGKFVCTECNKCFVSFRNLRFHVIRKHFEKLEELAPPGKRRYKCDEFIMAVCKHDKSDICRPSALGTESDKLQELTPVEKNCYKENQCHESEMVKCEECRIFCKHSNLRAHVKRKHPDKVDIIVPVTRNQYGSGSYACSECDKRFASFRNLRFHVIQKHFDKLEELAPVEKQNYKLNHSDKSNNVHNIQCEECKISFCKPSNLRAHVKRKHPDKLDVIAPITRNRSVSGSYICKECNKSFINFSNLRFHIKQKHFDKLDELAPVEKKVYKCNHCDSQFDVLKQFHIHKSSHKIIKTIKCSLCEYTGASTDILVQHYTQNHSLQIVNEKIEFDSVNDFQVWKSTIEAETFASYVKKCGDKKSLKHTKIKYICHRSGNLRTRSNNIRKPKTKGTNKIGGFCPAKMTVFTKNEKCIVQFCKTHVGHDQEKDMKHLFLTKSQREDIAAKIASKIPLPDILHEIRDLIKTSKPERIHLLTKKDLYNIETSFNLKDISVRQCNILQHLPNPSDEVVQFILSDNNLVIDPNMSELVSSTIPVENTQHQIDERRNILLQFVQEELFNATSLNEIDAAQKILAPLGPTVPVVRNQQSFVTNYTVASSSNMGHNENVYYVYNMENEDSKKCFSYVGDTVVL